MKYRFKIQLNRFHIFIKATFIGFFFIGPTFAQNTANGIEKLERQYLSTNFNPEDELSILNELASESIDPDKIIKYSDLLIKRAKQLDSSYYVYDGNLQKGNAYRLKGDFAEAFEFYQNALEIVTQKNDEINIAITNITIGDVHSEINNHDNALKYYRKSIDKLRELIKGYENNTINDELLYYLGAVLYNCGDEYYNVEDYEKALSYFYESSSLFKKLNNKQGSAYNLGSIGMVYIKQNKLSLAEASIKEAIAILESERDYPPISEYLYSLSEIYFQQGKTTLALDYAEKSRELAIEYELKNEMDKSNVQLSSIYGELNDYKNSLFYLKKHVVYFDSIAKVTKEVAKKETELQLAKKQLELDLRVQRNKNERVVMYSFLGGMVLVSFLAIGLYRRNRYVNKTKSIIEEQRKKADDLLLNILPKETAEELKETGKVIAQKYESATIVFTDFKDFTKLATTLSPEALVESVDMYFTKFDEIIKKYKLEKIKTIGDSYMFAGGIPTQSDNHAKQAVLASLEMIEYTANLKKVYKVNEVRFDIRIGIHTGPVVAGVVGKNKFTYDIWGDSVNIASRLESSSGIGKINISESTYRLVKDDFKCEPRGKIDIKNRGQIDMYYLSKKSV